MASKLQETMVIATRELRACYKKEGIVAGNHHFTDYWGRDGYFALLGSISLKDYKIANKMLALFYKNQRSDGLIPYRVMRGPVTLGKYLGHPSFYTKPRPTYKLRGTGCEVLDGTTLTLLFSGLLGIEKELDGKYILKIKKALSYLEERERSGLLWDGVMAEWNDFALKWGNLLYSNIIYWYALERLSEWTKTFDLNFSTKLTTKKNLVALSLRKKLWNGKFFADWYDNKRQDFLYPFGNCMAIVWGFTSPSETESILNECKKLKISFTLETNSPKYPWYRIDPLQRIAGVPDYQNKGLLWWQPGAAYLVALRKIGKTKEAEEVENKFIEKILSDKTIYECYERTGKPLKRFIYSAENPFAWASGMLVWSLKYGR